MFLLVLLVFIRLVVIGLKENDRLENSGWLLVS